ncbi:hypothetical protein V8F20_004032 [Naviculisporaceae sp. PSN 640]
MIHTNINYPQSFNTDHQIRNIHQKYGGDKKPWNEHVLTKGKDSGSRLGQQLWTVAPRTVAWREHMQAAMPEFNFNQYIDRLNHMMQWHVTVDLVPTIDTLVYRVYLRDSAQEFAGYINGQAVRARALSIARKDAGDLHDIVPHIVIVDSATVKLVVDKLRELSNDVYRAEPRIYLNNRESLDVHVGNCAITENTPLLWTLREPSSWQENDVTQSKTPCPKRF